MVLSAFALSTPPPQGLFNVDRTGAADACNKGCSTAMPDTGRMTGISMEGNSTSVVERYQDRSVPVVQYSSD